MNWQSYNIGRKHERETIKKELVELIEERKTKVEIIEHIRKI